MVPLNPELQELLQSIRPADATAATGGRARAAEDERRQQGRRRQGEGRRMTDEPEPCYDGRTEAPGAPYGADGDRTRNLSIANAALSQLSYGPDEAKVVTRSPPGKRVGRSDGFGTSW